MLLVQYGPALYNKHILNMLLKGNLYVPIYVMYICKIVLLMPALCRQMWADDTN